MSQLARNDVVRGLLRNLDHHSPGELAHAERVAVYAVAIGDALGFGDEELLSLRYAALLHDVGKVRVNANLLGKLGELTEEDLTSLRMHAELAMLVLDEVDFLHDSLPMIRHHHERWDGSGYPDGLAQEDIPLGARILTVAEVFDTMTLGPSWARRLGEEEALAEIKVFAGSMFDPHVVEVFLKVQPKIQPLGL